eukprot:252057-Rhodomonas_salina.2
MIWHRHEAEAGCNSKLPKPWRVAVRGDQVIGVKESLPPPHSLPVAVDSPRRRAPDPGAPTEPTRRHSPGQATSQSASVAQAAPVAAAAGDVSAVRTKEGVREGPDKTGACLLRDDVAPLPPLPRAPPLAFVVVAGAVGSRRSRSPAKRPAAVTSSEIRLVELSASTELGRDGSRVSAGEAWQALRTIGPDSWLNADSGGPVPLVVR